MALTEEQIEKLVAKVAGEIYGTRYTNQELKLAKAIIAALPKPEAVKIDWPEYHDEAMGCGLEDRNITDRYEAMRHGWDCAIERVADWLPETLYTEAPITQPASECQCSMTTKLVGDGCAHCNPEYAADNEAKPASAPSEQKPAANPSDEMVILGAEVLHDSIRAAGFYVDFDRNLNGSEIQQRIAESVYVAMQEASAPQPDYKAQRDALLGKIIEARQALQFANDAPCGPINDTIWMMHGPETLFDFLDAAIASVKGGA